MAEMNRYLIIIEETATGYSAYSPDVPGCVGAGKARDSVEREMHDAIEFHLDGLRRAGEPIPAPRSQASYRKWSERAGRHGWWVGDHDLGGVFSGRAQRELLRYK
jgi:predicted RNase H-like HicB family nuclease